MTQTELQALAEIRSDLAEAERLIRDSARRIKDRDDLHQTYVLLASLAGMVHRAASGLPREAA